jgi:hypothetical protein
MSTHELLVILLVGLVAGWLAGQIVRGTGYGLVADIAIGIVGRIDWKLVVAATWHSPREWDCCRYHLSDHRGVAAAADPFALFTIAAVGEAHGYPELKPSLKQKIFGLNGARVYGVDVPVRRPKTEADPIGTLSRLIGKWRIPTFETYGPKTSSEYDALIAERGGLPA